MVGYSFSTTLMVPDLGRDLWFTTDSVESVSLTIEGKLLEPTAQGTVGAFAADVFGYADGIAA
jgi:hypothetical protein